VSTKSRGRLAVGLIAASCLVTAILTHLYGRPVGRWLVSNGITGVPGKAVLLFTIFFFCYTLMVLALWIANLGATHRSGATALRLWLVFTLFLTLCMGWWILVDRFVPVLLYRLPESVSFAAQLGLLLAGVMGRAVLADRFGRRLGVNVWGAKRGRPEPRDGMTL
jgi:hypothetical protein